MDLEQLDEIVHIIAIGDSGAVEGLFNKPGGRRFLETVVLMLVCGLPNTHEDHEDLFAAFHKGLDKIERRIKRQQEGREILRQIYC